MEFYATCPAGFEKLLAQELASLGIPSVRPLQGQASFEGTLADGYKACLWSSLASRIVLVLGRVEAATSDELYEGVLSLPWEDHIGPAATLAIEAHGVNDALRNTKFVALRTKDAVSDRLLAKRGIRPATDTSRPDVRIAVRLGRSRASIGIDLSGEPLFRRGYGQLRSERSPLPPLRPDYAAALLASASWYRSIRHDAAEAAIVYSGAGTVAVEAARQALGRAAGLLRPSWGFAGWAGHDEAAWDALLADAEAKAEAGAGRAVEIVAADTRTGADASLRQMMRAAGMMEVAPRTFDMRRSPAELGQAIASLSAPALIVDLSWLSPDSLAQEAEALALVSQAASAARPGTTVGAISPDDSLDAVLGCAPSQTSPVIVGTQDASLRSYELAEVPQRPSVDIAGTPLPVLLETSDQFARRLQKVAKQRAKWAKREDITCYRVYDADLPDYAVAIEYWQAAGRPDSWLQIAEYAAPKEIDPALARRRLLDVLAIAPRIMKVAPDHTYLKVRTRAKGGSQYAAEAARSTAAKAPGYRRDGMPKLPAGAHLIEEGGLVFEVDFTNRLDCGIFLDHRETRAMVREMAKGTKGSKRFLNLFAYTGTATCYAADGGMHHTTSVDMSRPSLDWARRNMERNGFAGRDHEYVQADVLAWTREQRHTRNRWDLVFCDVPTFSNSSRMRSSSWDVQRDHAELLITVSRLLTRDGVCVFSCNLRSFVPDTDKLAKAGVEIEDITAQTIPEDFARNPKIHHCYLVKRTPLPEGALPPAPRAHEERPHAKPSRPRPPRPDGRKPHSSGPRPHDGRPGQSRPHGRPSGSKPPVGRTRGPRGGGGGSLYTSRTSAQF